MRCEWDVVLLAWLREICFVVPNVSSCRWSQRNDGGLVWARNARIYVFKSHNLELVWRYDVFIGKHESMLKFRIIKLAERKSIALDLAMGERRLVVTVDYLLLRLILPKAWQMC